MAAPFLKCDERLIPKVSDTFGVRHFGDKCLHLLECLPGDEAVAAPRLGGDVSAEPEWGSEGIGGGEVGELDLDPCQALERPVEDIELGSAAARERQVVPRLAQAALGEGPHRVPLGGGQRDVVLLALQLAAGHGRNLLGNLVDGTVTLHLLAQAPTVAEIILNDIRLHHAGQAGHLLDKPDTFDFEHNE